MYLQSKKDYMRLEEDGAQIYVLETAGGMPYLDTAKIAERWNLNVCTVRQYCAEIEAIARKTTKLTHLIGRYPEEAVLGQGKSRRINEFVFADYYAHRAMLQDKTKAKFVREFSPSRYAGLMGYYNRPVREWTDEDVRIPARRKKKAKDNELLAKIGELLQAASQ